jgi:hypothetical protein
MIAKLRNLVLSVLMLPLFAAAADGACLPSQSCDLQVQQQRTESLQRQTDKLRSTVSRNEQELQRARSDLLLSPRSSTLPLQRLQQRKRINDAQDNLRDSQRDYWQSQNQLLDSRRSLQRLQQPRPR